MGLEFSSVKDAIDAVESARDMDANTAGSDKHHDNSDTVETLNNTDADTVSSDDQYDDHNTAYDTEISDTDEHDNTFTNSADVLSQDNITTSDTLQNEDQNTADAVPPVYIISFDKSLVYTTTMDSAKKFIEDTINDIYRDLSPGEVLEKKITDSDDVYRVKVYKNTGKYLIEYPTVIDVYTAYKIRHI